MKNRIHRTLTEILKIDAPSGQETKVAQFVLSELSRCKIAASTDTKGNVIGYLDGLGETVLLNAHLDRVPPGKGHTPTITGDILRSDGTTNLGADDAAGVTIILNALEAVKENNLHHPPIVAAFTVEEETGLWGAKALDVKKYKPYHGIVYDNAFDAGTVVSEGASYTAVNIEIRGKSTHPGKNLKDGINAVEIFRQADFPLGETDNGLTRINIGTLAAGVARNTVPDALTAQCEIRSFLSGDNLKSTIGKFTDAFVKSSEKKGGKAVITINQLAAAYRIDPNEILIREYKKTVENRGGKFISQKTFIASDANTLRAELGLKVFVVSTGVTNEHSREETVKLTDLEVLTEDLISLLRVI